MRVSGHIILITQLGTSGTDSKSDKFLRQSTHHPFIFCWTPMTALQTDVTPWTPLLDVELECLPRTAWETERPVRTQDIQLAGLPSSPWLQCWRNPSSGSAYLFSKGVSVIMSCSESLQPFNLFFFWGLATSSIFVLYMSICLSHQFLSIHKSPLSLGGSTFTCTFALQYFACHKHS